MILCLQQISVVQLRKMSSSEKSITISIVKVLNWTEDSSREHLQLEFHSLLSQTLILQKNIRATVNSRQLLINTSLKITYTGEESQVLLKMSRIEEGRASMFLSEFVIDLELLAQRKIQYLAFDKNDKILEVVDGTPTRDGSKNQRPVIDSTRLDTFIQEKSNYLRNVSSQNGSTTWPLQRSSTRDNFTQKLFSLLQETRRLKEKMQRQKRKPELDNVGYSSDEFNKNSQKLSSNGEEATNERLLIKSSSQNLLSVANSFKKNGRKAQKAGAAASRWTVAARCKLDLKSLAILDASKLTEDPIKQDEDEVLRSKQEGFSAFKGNRQQLSAYLPNTNQNS